ncbi:hypothetical protein FQN57_006933 [Myotisia sp. PD_48]|nr:hypothetical protein FQN57_006933 [Myotisia sp. PD_48]
MGERLGFYLPRKYRSDLAFKVLIVFELALTIALLALFGIAAPNLYRKKLWQDGADNGFNSSPDQMVYTLANHNPYTIPRPWSQFTTNFNLIISVLSMFFLIVKAPMFVLNVFYPPMSVFIHAGLIAIYCVSAAFQAGSDTTDAAHLQNGPPWYITKSCNVAKLQVNVGYCRQAKSAFACTIIITLIFTAQFALAVVSCLPTEEIREKQREKAERKITLEELKSLKSPLFPNGESGFPPVTPRTMAFNQLGGHTDLPLRVQTPVSQRPQADAENQVEGQHTQPHGQAASQPQTPMYFPPPPKKPSK